MKVDRQLIRYGRTIGVENIGQIKKFIRQIVKNGKGSLHLENDVREAFNYARRADDANKKALGFFGLSPSDFGIPSAVQSVRMTASYFPMLFQKGNKSVVDVVAQRVGKSGHIVSLNGGVISQTGERLSNTSAKVGGNSNGFFVNINSEIEDVGARIKAFVVPRRTSGASREALLKSVTISSENGIGQMGIAPTRTRGIKAEAHLKAPIDMLDDMVSVCTCGELSTFADFIKLFNK